jgi:PEGA domain-containing protein
MKILWTLFAILSVTAFAAEQSVPAPLLCSKNVSFAVAEGGQPVPAIPKFTLKWLGNKARQQSYHGLCFSQIPSANANNYIIIFSTSESTFEGLNPSAHTYTSAKPAVENTGAINSYGGTWNYSYVGVPAPATTTTLDLKRDDKPKSLYVRTYDQQGRIISRYNLNMVSSRERLLEQALADILRDSSPPPNQKPFLAPLSVYYVNCDVDGPPAQTPMEPLSPRPTEPPHKDPTTETVLDIWSNPPGADIFLDGGYMGKTPNSQAVPPGEHTITLRKKDFATWQRKVLVTPGKRRVTAYLEQKVLTLQ